MHDIDHTLIIQASQGDTEAFERVYKASSSFVYTIAFRITNKLEDAQDVTQEVFIKVYRKLKTFNFKSTFKTWLYRITVNTALNAINKKKYELHKGTDYELIKNSLGTHEPIDKTLDQQDTEQQISSMLMLLNPDQRACILLREIEGFDYKQIAEILNTNINTVRTRLKRAREKLMSLHQKEVVYHEL